MASRGENPLKVFLGGLWVNLDRGSVEIDEVARQWPALPPPVRGWVGPVLSFKESS